MYPRTVMTGQMFLVERAGPLFIIREMVTGVYEAIVTSHVSGDKMAESGGYKTIEKAVAWCYEFHEY